MFLCDRAPPDRGRARRRGSLPLLVCIIFTYRIHLLRSRSFLLCTADKMSNLSSQLIWSTAISIFIKLSLLFLLFLKVLCEVSALNMKGRRSRQSGLWRAALGISCRFDDCFTFPERNCATCNLVCVIIKLLCIYISYTVMYRIFLKDFIINTLHAFHFNDFVTRFCCVD